MTCNWPVDDSCLPELPGRDDPNYEQTMTARQAALDLAVSVLWALSGRQFGVCPTLVRPCPPGMCGGGFRAGSTWNQTAQPFIPTYEYGRWVNYTCGCTGRCNAAGPRTIHLPGPVAGIVTVTIGGEALDPSEYVLEGDMLYRKGTNWPSQDYNKPLDENGTWSVNYLKGWPVPDGVAVFVGQLAKEFLAACSGDQCRLPRNVVSTTSRGVSRVFDPSAIYAAGKTGLSEIDLWLSAVNPYHILQAPKVT
jgi:hypothetical protein